MQGLCGNFDSDLTNDLHTIDGIMESVTGFVESWKTEQSCVTQKDVIFDESKPCHDHIERKEWATKECSLISLPGHDNPFTPCIAKLDSTDITRSHAECLYDACSCDKGGDCECLCSSLAAFGELCNKIGVPVKWRTQHRCPIQCEYGKQYLPCGPLCQQTCMDLSTGNNPQCPDAGCIEGCFCPEGYVADYEGKCIKPAECDCYSDSRKYPPGSKLTKDCLLCECINGTFDCSQTIPDCDTCNNKTEFTCIKDQTCIPIEWRCVNMILNSNLSKGDQKILH